MKKKVKIIVACLLIGLFLSSCSIFGERKRCPAYSKVEMPTQTDKC